MTPREKAKELVDKINSANKHLNYSRAKTIALLCVDEIELYRKQIENEYDEDLYHAYGQEEYWVDVRQEVSLL